MQYAYTYISIPEITILGHSDPKWVSQLNLCWNLMQYACTYILIPEITILGHSDHQTGIMIEFTLKFDAICMYICPDSRNYHIRLLQSQNRYHDWIPTEISYTTPNELTREYPQSNTQVCMSSMDTLWSSIFNTPVCSLDTFQISILNYGKLIGHPPEFNIQLQ